MLQTLCRGDVKRAALPLTEPKNNDIMVYIESTNKSISNCENPALMGQKYYCTYNINHGGSFASVDGCPKESGKIAGNNYKEVKKALNARLREFGAKKNAPFSWWWDITCEKLNYVESNINGGWRKRRII